MQSFLSLGYRLNLWTYGDISNASVGTKIRDANDGLRLRHETGADIHRLPEIFHYWSRRYISPFIHQVFGTDSITEIYARPLARMFDAGRERKRKFVSIGSGDCSEEIKIAKRLLESVWKSISSEAGL